MRRSRLYLTPSRFSDPDLHPLSQGLPHGSDHVSTLLQAFKTLTKRFIAPAGDVSFLMSTPLTTTQYYPVLRSGFVPPGRQAFHLLHVCPSMGWSGLSLTYTYQVEVGSDDSHTISKLVTPKYRANLLRIQLVKMVIDSLPVPIF